MRLSIRRIVSRVSSAGGPLGVFLADQAFESPGELRVPIVLSVRPGLCKLEVILVFQRSGRGMAGDPVFLELVKVLGASSATMTAARQAIPYTDCAGQSRRAARRQSQGA